MKTVLQINVEFSPEVLDKFIHHYPDNDAIANEVMRQIEESGSLMTGKPVVMKYRPYKEV